jgi:hypothetical protein
MAKKSMKIKGEDLTGEYIFQKATELTTLHEQVTLITNYLDTVVLSVSQGDEFAGAYFLKSNALSDVVDNLQTISDKLVKISNSLCVNE